MLLNSGPISHHFLCPGAALRVIWDRTVKNHDAAGYMRWFLGHISQFLGHIRGMRQATMGPSCVQRRFLAPFWGHLGVILHRFWRLWGKWWIFENVCFVWVKPHFLRFWRVSCQYFFVILVHWPTFVSFFLQSEFIRGPKGSKVELTWPNFAPDVT